MHSKDTDQKGFKYFWPFALFAFNQSLQFPQDMGATYGMFYLAKLDLATPTIMDKPTCEFAKYGFFTFQRFHASFFMYEKICVKQCSCGVQPV